VELGQWDYAMSTRDQAHLVRDAKKSGMSAHAVAKLEEAMQRVEEGSAKSSEVSKVRGEIFELRVNQDGKWYRLLFSKFEERYVALLLGAKKTNQLDKNWIATAAKRLSQHESKTAA
jgi:phage-related protein